MLTTRNAAWGTLGGLVAYNAVQNTIVPDRWYVPANTAVAVGLVAAARAAGASPADLGLEAAGVPGGLRLAAPVAGLTALALAGLSRTRRGRVMLRDERARGHRPATALYLAAVRFPVGTALFEEVAFRGVLYGLWKLRSGPTRAALVASGAFGAWHILPTLRTIPGSGLAEALHTRRAAFAGAFGGAAVTFAAGLGFTVLRERARSVAAPWLAHAAFNSLSYLAARRVWEAGS